MGPNLPALTIVTVWNVYVSFGRWYIWFRELLDVESREEAVQEEQVPRSLRKLSHLKAGLGDVTELKADWFAGQNPILTTHRSLIIGFTCNNHDVGGISGIFCFNSMLD
jgi:hypothetical protein